MSRFPLDFAERGARYLWYKTAVPVFIERYLLAILATATFVLLVLDPMKFDWTQKITFGLAALAGAYFLAHTVHRYNQTPKQSPPTAPAQSSGVAQETTKSGYELIGGIENTSVGNPAKLPKDVAIMLIVTIRNAGSPTIIRDWSLEVAMPERVPSKARLVFINPNEPVTMTLGNNQPWVLSAQDALYTKHADAPLPTGGQVTGFLVFGLENSSRLDVYRQGTILNLSFKDVKGNEYRASYTIKGEPDNKPMYYPGMQPPPPQTPQKKKKRRK